MSEQKNSPESGRVSPYIPCGPFQIRFPFIHYRIEKSEFIQGLIIGSTALVGTYFLTEYFGLPYELAYTIVIIEAFMYIFHGTLGDPVVPGWITAALPLVLAFVSNYTLGPERIQAMMALQILVAAIFIFMSVTHLATRFVNWVPDSIKAGILLAAPISVIQGQLGPKGGLVNFPISLLGGFIFLTVIMFSLSYQRLRKNLRFLDFLAQYGSLFPYLFAMFLGIAVGELDVPQVEMGTFLKIPDISAMMSTTSIFAVGVPTTNMFISAFPLAIICYIIAFGDFVTTDTLIKEAQESRNDEKIELDSDRSNLISGIRNLILGLFCPYPLMAGPLWAGLTVSVCQRYKEGKKAMESLIGGMTSFRLATFLCVIIIPVTTFMKPVYVVGGPIALLFQAIVCAKIGMDYCHTNEDRMIGGMMAAVLAFCGAAWGLLAGAVLYLMLKDISFDRNTSLRRKKAEEHLEVKADRANAEDLVDPE